MDLTQILGTHVVVEKVIEEVTDNAHEGLDIVLAIQVILIWHVI